MCGLQFLYKTWNKMVNAISPDFSYQKIAPTIPLFSLYGIKHLASSIKFMCETQQNDVSKLDNYDNIRTIRKI